MTLPKAPRTPAEAIEWGRRQITHPTQDWTRLCLSFVRQSYGITRIVPDANTAWNTAQHKHRTSNPNAAPRGAAVFFETPTTADHVVISLGDGRCLTNDFVRPGRIDVAHIADIAARWNAPLLGWTEDVNGHRILPAPEPSPTVFGLDISRFQPGIDLKASKESGVRFVAAKATEGQGVTSPQYAAQLRGAREAGLLFAAYHFLRSDSPVAAQAQNLAEHIVDKTVPVMIDCEVSGSSRPTMAHVRGFAAECKKRGLRVTLLYLPSFWWQQIGRPDLTGWRLWQALYGTNPVGSPAAIYPGDGSDRWDRMGGVTPTLLQFGSRGRVKGYDGDIDVNAYRGTLAQLKASGLFKDLASPPPPEPTPPAEPTRVQLFRRECRELLVKYLDPAVADGRDGVVEDVRDNIRRELRRLPEW